MIALVSKNLSCLILKHTSPFVCKSPVSFALPLRFISTLTETQLGITPTVFDFLLHKYEFPPELALRAASKLAHLENPVEKADSVLSFLKQSGFSNSQLVKIVKFGPRFLAARLECSIKPKIKTLQDLGFSSDDIAKMISANPRILQLSLEKNIIPSLSVMKELFGSYYEVARFTRLYKWFRTSNLEKSVLPNIEFLKSCGIPMERVRIILTGHPSCFTIKPEVMRKYAEKAKEMGLDASSKSFIYAIPTLAKMSTEAWELKLQGFRDLGFSDKDIVAMFRKDPRAFSVSIEKVKKVKEVLLASGKFNMSCIVNLPNSLTLSVENRYIPRLWMLQLLEDRNLIKNWPNLSTLTTLSDDRFFKKFISPYSNEVSFAWITKTSVSARKEMKP